MKKIISTAFLLVISVSANMLSAQSFSKKQMQAIQSDDVASFKKNFSKADYNKCFPLKDETFSALGFSSLYGRNNIVKFLLDNQADINKECNGKTPLALAKLGNKEQTVQLLIQKGAANN
ncbi:ankyrin repeat domain-containing protein [Chryseobacterium lathyri]|uniref:Ankyrin repeat protein n=1 Tax=Chryseobacterium lathyri TaxID=395933 RepID=A0ABT9SPE9_9FLAO|nr:ankyrin repeat domain-containing protein [Chryseobacterium lathyri]MDP9961310.1 ankyrin repeat protein [Chryseobacterium lathyri]MDQ0067971.1 ankyrin repeat protein [Chryseobacterium lathyri]